MTAWYEKCVTAESHGQTVYEEWKALLVEVQRVGFNIKDLKHTAWDGSSFTCDARHRVTERNLSVKLFVPIVPIKDCKGTRKKPRKKTRGGREFGILSKLGHTGTLKSFISLFL